ncbi:MAG: type II toxin-antitoxin system MqsA family antitoxin [Phycisphaerae bacterium]
MTCVICKSGQTRPGTTTVVLQREGTTVVTHDVPAAVCENCGEAYVSEEVTASLLKEGHAVAATSDLVIRGYAA